MLVVDLMHEFELGVWRAIFIHLLRILDSESETLKHELDKRYTLYYLGNSRHLWLSLFRFREIPPFGHDGDGVRKITSNRSELKKMTAHDFEDMLQVGALTPGLSVGLHYSCSALYLYSMVYSPNPTILAS
jgi:hypothetical protein